MQTTEHYQVEPQPRRGALLLRSLVKQRCDGNYIAAAREIGLSKYYVQSIAAGRMLPGRPAQIKLAEWSRPEPGADPLIGLRDWLSDVELALFAGLDA